MVFRCQSLKGIKKSRHSLRTVPTRRSQMAFAFGLADRRAQHIASQIFDD